MSFLCRLFIVLLTTEDVVLRTRPGISVVLGLDLRAVLLSLFRRRNIDTAFDLISLRVVTPPLPAQQLCGGHAATAALRKRCALQAYAAGAAQPQQPLDQPALHCTIAIQSKILCASRRGHSQQNKSDDIIHEVSPLTRP
eukprot:gnl/TRDRNA2_/TRDRNA2_156377_c0_seq5.p1 gnl/TRDRNA2_/TRDRNA2_156377_c0~~gnl/TRDRNA2_/TRDRNA2_156377_c0_seq5.p1  ORF type:complete len:140 (-),score=7.21 gnl/TRDRNA2_/TRDRNA2_156377_c0_seq5:9-428(-)